MEYFLKGLDGREKMSEWDPEDAYIDAGKGFGIARWIDVQKELRAREDELRAREEEYRASRKTVPQIAVPQITASEPPPKRYKQ